MWICYLCVQCLFDFLSLVFFCGPSESEKHFHDDEKKKKKFFFVVDAHQIKKKV